MTLIDSDYQNLLHGIFNDLFRKSVDFCNHGGQMVRKSARKGNCKSWERINRNTAIRQLPLKWLSVVQHIWKLLLIQYICAQWSRSKGKCHEVLVIVCTWYWVRYNSLYSLYYSVPYCPLAPTSSWTMHVQLRKQSIFIQLKQPWPHMDQSDCGGLCKKKQAQGDDLSQSQCAYYWPIHATVSASLQHLLSVPHWAKHRLWGSLHI